MAKADEHEWCHSDFHRCDGGGPGEYARYLEQPQVKRWRTIVVDPPWPYKDRLMSGTGNGGYQRARGAANHYSLLTMGDLAAIPMCDWSEPDAHLYIWTTNSFMVEAHDLARAWGFDQKTILTWCKSGIGMGRYYRNATEHVLFAVRGKLPTAAKNVRTWFQGEQGRHSEKPQAFYDMVESMSPGPYLDVFARKQRLGWDVAGNEVYSAIPELAAKPER